MKEMKDKKIKEWTGIFRDIYSKVDSERTPEQMWIAVMAHTSSIGESIRKFAFESLLESAAHTFCWLCTFVNKCNNLRDDIFSITESLGGIVSLKYPGVCGHCRQIKCQCDPVEMEKKINKSAEYQKLLELRRSILASFEDYSIDDFTKKFYEIYGGRIHIQTLENIGFHFLEEIGEAAVSIRKLSQLRKITDDNKTRINLPFLKKLSTVEGIVENYSNYKPPEKIKYASTDPSMLRARVVEAKMSLVVEIADSFSWFCAILNKLDLISKFIYDHPKKHKIIKPLEQVLTEVYLDSNHNPICPTCGSMPCKCVFYNLTTGDQRRLTTVTSREERKAV